MTQATWISMAMYETDEPEWTSHLIRSSIPRLGVDAQASLSLAGGGDNFRINSMLDHKVKNGSGFAGQRSWEVSFTVAYGSTESPRLAE
jgi:hypothetical protein